MKSVKVLITPQKRGLNVSNVDLRHMSPGIMQALEISAPRNLCYSINICQT